MVGRYHVAKVNQISVVKLWRGFVANFSEGVNSGEAVLQSAQPTQKPEKRRIDEKAQLVVRGFVRLHKTQIRRQD